MSSDHIWPSFFKISSSNFCLATQFDFRDFDGWMMNCGGWAWFTEALGEESLFHQSTCWWLSRSQASGSTKATDVWSDQVRYGSRTVDSEPEVLFLPGLGRTRRLWISITSTTLPIHKSQLREIFECFIGLANEVWMTWKLNVKNHCFALLAYPWLPCPQWNLCWNQLKGKHATYSPSIFALGSSTNLWEHQLLWSQQLGQHLKLRSWSVFFSLPDLAWNTFESKFGCLMKFVLFSLTA